MNLGKKKESKSKYWTDTKEADNAIDVEETKEIFNKYIDTGEFEKVLLINEDSIHNQFVDLNDSLRESIKNWVI